MKKAFLAIWAVVCLFSVTGCACEHAWKEATCTTPKTCESCGETEGEPIAHSFAAATCTELKTCKNCGFTEGTAAGHTWIEATCIAPKACETCNTAEGDLGEHVWTDATYSTPNTCELCGATEGEPLVRTDFSTEVFYNSDSCLEVTNLFHKILPEGWDFSASYAEMDLRWNLYLNAPTEAKNSYAQDLESWKQLKTNLIEFSAEAQEIFIKDGFEIDFKIWIYDNPDANTSHNLQDNKVMLEMENGNVLRDVLDTSSPTTVTTPFLESTAYKEVHQLITSSYADYEPRFELKDNILYVYFTAPDGTDLALTNPSDQARADWKTQAESLTEMSYLASLLFTGDGYDVLCAIMYISDLNPEEALLCAIGGQVIYNCLE